MLFSLYKATLDAAGALYLASVPYLVFFIWLWFVD